MNRDASCTKNAGCEPASNDGGGLATAGASERLWQRLVSGDQSTHWDVIVVGAGVAGSIAARELARSGHRVLLVDKKSFPRRKVCGACLNAAALEILDKLDLTPAIDRLGGRPLHRFSLGQGSRSVSLPLPGGIALSRESFDTALIAAAIEAGVTFLPETAALLGNDGSRSREVRLNHADHEIRLTGSAVIVAAGLGGVSTTGASEWKTKISSSARIGTGCVVADRSQNYATGTIWMAAAKGGYVGLVRVEDDRLNVAAALDRDCLRAHGSPAAAAQSILESAGFAVPQELSIAEWQGTVPLTRSTTPVAAGRTFLIGDAAGYVEPFTGEGMTWALLSGQYVADWVAQAVSSPLTLQTAAAGWRREYFLRIERRQRFCRVATRLIRCPQLLAFGLSALSIWPGLARLLIQRMNATTSQGRLINECRS